MTHILQIILPYLTGVISGVILTIASGFSKEIFDERARKAKHKINVAREVHNIVVEARAGKYKIPPRDLEHIHSVIIDLGGIDETQEEMLAVFANYWSDYAKGKMVYMDGVYPLAPLSDVKGELRARASSLIWWEREIRVGKKKEPFENHLLIYLSKLLGR